MYTEINIRDFRGFELLTVAPLDKLNLIAGMNNVGKTALLEAIYLLAGAANLAEPVAQLVSRQASVPITGQPAEVWGGLFFQQDLGREIDLEGLTYGNDFGHINLTLKYADWETLDASQSEQHHRAGGLIGSYSSKEPTVESKVLIFASPTGEIRATIRPRPETSLLEKVRYVGLERQNAKDDLNMYSDLVRKGQVEDLLNILRQFEPRLQRLEILIDGIGPALYGDLGTAGKLPLTLMGDGMNRLLSILLTIASTRYGVVLIDEFENGLHHTMLQNVWAAVAQAAAKYGVQIFATTHSYEFIQAAHLAMASEPGGKLMLHRLDRTSAGIEATSYDSETLAAALDMNLEAR